MNTKHVFLFNADAADHVTVDGRTVKQRGKDAPGKVLEFDGLRVAFNDDFAAAAAQGVTERIDSAFLNLDDLRTGGSEIELMVLGRGKKIKVALG